jgi:hypothetical protein
MESPENPKEYLKRKGISKTPKDSSEEFEEMNSKSRKPLWNLVLIKKDGKGED